MRLKNRDFSPKIVLALQLFVQGRELDKGSHQLINQIRKNAIISSGPISQNDLSGPDAYIVNS